MKTKLKLVAVGLLLLSGCANSPQKVSGTTSPEGLAVADAAAREAEAHSFVEISFDKGSSNLTENSRTAIRNLVSQTSSDNIDEIMVMSWADQEYPSAQRERLSAPQRELADKRNKAVEQYVKSQRDLDVDTYNMAERPGAMSKLFNTTDNRLKKSLVSAGLPTTAGTPFPSKASRSVVLMKIK